MIQQRTIGAFFVGFAAFTAADVFARTLAQLHSHSPLDLIPANGHVPRFALMLLTAGACGHAAAFHSRRAVYVLLSCTLAPYAYFAYWAEFSFHSAIVEKPFNGAALASGFAWIASVLSVIVGIPLAFGIDWLLGRRTRRRIRRDVG